MDPDEPPQAISPADATTTTHNRRNLRMSLPSFKNGKERRTAPRLKIRKNATWAPSENSAILSDHALLSWTLSPRLWLSLFDEIPGQEPESLGA